MCKRKGLVHIGFEQCIEMHDPNSCDGCTERTRINEVKTRERVEANKRAAERRALIPVRKKKNE